MTRLNIYRFELSTDASKYASGLWELVRVNGQKYWVDRNIGDASLPRKLRRIIRRLVAHKTTNTHVTNMSDEHVEWETYRIAL